MHFIKTLLSVAAVVSFSSAFSFEDDDAAENLALREESFQKRAEYLEARDNLFPRARQGTCAGYPPRMVCVTRINGKNAQCGTCSARAKTGVSCPCKSK